MNLTPEEIEYIHETRQVLDELELCKDILERIRRTPVSEYQKYLLVQTNDQITKFRAELKERASVLLYKYPLLCNQRIIDDFAFDSQRSGRVNREYHHSIGSDLCYYVISYKNTVQFISVQYQNLFQYQLQRDENKEKKIQRVYNGFDYITDIIFELLRLFAGKFSQSKEFIASLKTQKKE